MWCLYSYLVVLHHVRMWWAGPFFWFIECTEIFVECTLNGWITVCTHAHTHTHKLCGIGGKFQYTISNTLLMPFSFYVAHLCEPCAKWNKKKYAIIIITSACHLGAHANANKICHTPKFNPLKCILALNQLNERIQQ